MDRIEQVNILLNLFCTLFKKRMVFSNLYQKQSKHVGKLKITSVFKAKGLAKGQCSTSVKVQSALL